MLCDDCEKTVLKYLYSRSGFITNCMAYGCENHGTNKKCNTEKFEEIIDECMGKIKSKNKAD